MDEGLSEIIIKYSDELKTTKEHLSRKNPDVIVIGESHIDLEHPYLIADLIKKYKPEYVLYEGFNKKNIPTFLNKEEKIGLSLQELCEKYGVSLEEAGFTEKALNKKIFENILSRITKHTQPVWLDDKLYLYCTNIDQKYLPNTYEEIISKPIVTYHPAILEYFLEILDKKYKEIKENILNKKYYNTDQEKSIVTLYSSLNNIILTLKSAKTYSMLFRRHLDPIIPRVYVILSAVYDVDAKIGECDLDFEEKNKMLKDCLRGKISQKYYHNLRERAMADSIEKYVKKRKTDTPIIAIIGRGHLNNVAKLLDDKGINYKMIELEDSIKDLGLELFMSMKYSYDLHERCRQLEKLLQQDKY